MTRPSAIPIALLMLLALSLKAQTATVLGVVLDENQNPIPQVNISSGNLGTSTNENGYYQIELIAETKNTLVFSHLGHQQVVLEDLILNTNETYEFNPVMKIDVIQVDGVDVMATGSKNVEGITTISPEMARKIPGANAGVENILKLLPGVSFNNELSTQYNVRGGNFDENLVYVNGIAVYRPFLVRSAQQEGLSFVNSDMISSLKFSAGGFQAKYGDRLSSVLDIEYKIPVDFGLRLNGSLLGAGTTLETASKNQRFTSISGLRYRNNALLVNSQQTQSNLNPTFVDFQSFLTYRFSKKFHLNFLGTYASNDYENEPISRQTNFGTLNEPRVLSVFYEGMETSTYNSASAAIKGDYFYGDNTKLSFIGSIYHTQEEEISDVIASYELGEVETDLGSPDLGEPTTSSGVGSQLNRARNKLDALIVNLVHNGVFKKKGTTIEWGIKYTHEDFRDQLRESEFIDSAGFFIRPSEPEFINNQPEEPFTGDIVPFESVNATNFVNTHRFSGFAQYATYSEWGNNTVYWNLGIRSQLWTLDGEGIAPVTQTLLSPRGQFAIKPNWKRDILFRFAMGSYQQPALYRELRGPDATINPDVAAQKSIHYVLGSEYSFNLWEQPFTLIGEAFYKSLYDVNPFTIEDVRIRYAAENNTEAFAYGFDFRFTGAFVPGTQSWISLGYLQTQENQEGRGYIPRPTDQRFKFAMLFQDYVPSIPNLRLYLNLVYNTGVPGGSPNNSDPYNFQNRLRDYRRADMGISYIFADEKYRHPEGHWLHAFKEFQMGFEIFNLFNNQNSITNTWVRDVDTRQQFAVPNFLTSRVLNVKIEMRF